MELAIFTSEFHRVVVEFRSVPDTYDRLWVGLSSSAEEQVYGGGEQFSSFNLKGKKYPIWTNEQGK